MRMLAFYGKGGIGKSTVVTNLAVLFARQGLRVLQFGCDPKADSCYSLVTGPVRTVMDEWLASGEEELRLEHCLMQTEHGVHCLEVGGPTPGTGCGGRGITKAFELIGEAEALRTRYDVVLFDVLGDVVCGGFSAPLRARYANEVYIVTSGELRSLYAANNIAHAVKRFSRDGVRLGGIVANLRDNPREQERVELLARELGSRVLHYVPKDRLVVSAEEARVPLVTFAPHSDITRAYEALHARIDSLGAGELCTPYPLLREEFDELFFSSAAPAPKRPEP